MRSRDLSSEQSEVEILREAYRLYEGTVRVVQALAKFFSDNPELLDNFVFGKSLKYKRNGEWIAFKPDIIAVYDNRTTGLIVEIKWSISNHFSTAAKEISKLKRYAYNISGWKGAIGRQQTQDVLANHDLVLLAHSDDVGLAKQVIADLIRSDPTIYQFLRNDGFALWSFGEEYDRSRNEVIRIRNFYGGIRHSDLDKKSKSRIDIPLEAIAVERNMILFMGDTVPESYIILKIMMMMFNWTVGHEGKREEICISIKQINDLFNHYYPPITSDSAPQITSSILKEKCDKLAGFRYNLKPLTREEINEKGLDQDETWYIFTPKIPQNPLEWILTQLVRQRRRNDIRRRKQEEKKKLKRVQILEKKKKSLKKVKPLSEFD
jgi:hypothetical protein